MTNTIEIKHRVMTTVASTEIKLPFYYRSGKHVKHYCCMTEEFKLINISAHGGYMATDVSTYDDIQDVTSRLERDFDDSLFEIIDEAVFMHHFSLIHRELFYVVNSNLRPNE